MKQSMICLIVVAALQLQAQSNEGISSRVGTLEVVTFRIKEGIPKMEASAKLAALEDLVSTYEGFISRQLSMNENGTWIDIIEWTSKSKALQAAEEVMQNPKAAEIFAIMDESTIQMEHYQLIHSTNKNID